MTDKIKFETVQDGRWAVRNALSAGVHAIKDAGALPTKVDRYARIDHNRFVDEEPLGAALNKTARVRKVVLRGLEGLPQAAQSERITEARVLIESARSDLTLAKEASKDPEFQALMVSVRDGAFKQAKLDATNVLTLSRTRDFDAHQAAKKAAQDEKNKAFEDEFGYDDDAADDLEDADLEE